jgi:hypothetical protein
MTLLEKNGINEIAEALALAEGKRLRLLFVY